MTEEDEEFERIKRRIELETLPLINFTKQKEWVDLTDDEIWEAYMKAPLTLDCSTDELYALARTVEAKLKAKNFVDVKE